MSASRSTTRIILAVSGVLLFTAIAYLAPSVIGRNDSNPVKLTPVEAKVIGIPGVNEKNFPLVDGSTSVNPLLQLISSRAYGLDGSLRKLPGFGRGTVMLTFPLESSNEELERFNKLRNTFFTSGTNGAYMSLVAPQSDPVRILGATPGMALPPVHSPAAPNVESPKRPSPDLIIVAREPSVDELKYAKENGVEFDVRPVAIDAFVFLVNAENPVKSLTLDQIRGIYTGKVKNWSELGGKDAAIEPFSRDRNSGSQELMEKLVMKSEKMITIPEAVLMTMMGPIDKVSTTPNAVAYSVYYYESVMDHNTRNRLLGINGVVPTSKTIADKSYPLTAEVYVVTRKDLKPGDPAAKLRDWLLSPDGQRVVSESGYVPIKKIK